MFLGYELLNLGFCSVWEGLLHLRLEDPTHGLWRQGKLEEYLDFVSVTLLGRPRKHHLQKELRKKERRQSYKINYIVFVEGIFSRQTFSLT